ncbi:hypothetical protein [Micromonospora sp. NPDC005806]|uniref:hypothetical protein n=1 Tax=Micromonospora sp. NPDC005806 TaxID=3364234 RepID=UPI00367ED077
MEKPAVYGSDVVRRLCVCALVTLVVRPVTWVVTFGFLGPAFGWFDYLAWDATDGDGQRAIIVAIWLLPAVAVVVALKVAQQVHRGSERAARAVPALGFVFLAATAVYLAGIAVVGLRYAPLVQPAVLVVVVPVAAVQLYLLRLSWRIWRWRPETA